jgi:hypothetical protein
MTRTFFYEPRIGQTIIAQVEDDRFVQLGIERHLRAKYKNLRHAIGYRYTARLKSRLSPTTARVDLGIMGGEAFLTPCPDLPEGSDLDVVMVRLEIPEPGRWKLPVVKPVPGNKATSCTTRTHFQFEQDPIELYQPVFDEVLVRDLAAAAKFKKRLESDPVFTHLSSIALSVDPDRMDSLDLDGLLDQLVSGVFPIPNGTLYFERTKAMLMIDIDGTAGAVDVNQTAAREIPRLLKLFGIGGPVGIDFLGMQSKSERQMIDQALEAGCKQFLGQHDRTAMNGFGFVQLVLPKHMPSVLDVISGTCTGLYSIESQALNLIHDAARSRGAGTRILCASKAVLDQIRSWPSELAELSATLGVPVDFSEQSANANGHVHVRPL